MVFGTLHFCKTRNLQWPLKTALGLQNHLRNTWLVVTSVLAPTFYESKKFYPHMKHYSQIHMSDILLFYI